MEEIKDNIAKVFLKTLKREDLNLKELIILDEIWDGLSNEEKRRVNEKLDEELIKSIIK